MHKNILIIAGMHRSGTSLTANILQESGLYIGKNLLNSSVHNQKGFFEDIDFLKFHIDILGKNKKKHLLVRPYDFYIPGEIYSKAKELVKAKNINKNWGWKDPRTTLFLSFWNELIPQAKYLIIYRPFLEVVDSLLRRVKKFPLRTPANYVTGEHVNNIDLFIRNTFYKTMGKLDRKVKRFSKIINSTFLLPLGKIRGSYINIPLVRLYEYNWFLYNEYALDFYYKNKDKCIILSLETFLKKFNSIVKYMNEDWGFSLEYVDIKDIFEPNLLHKRISRKKCYFNMKKLEKVFQRLEKAQCECLDKLKQSNW